MSQMQWVYIDDYGRRHRVGLYHGLRTGHLMIYCNTRVVVIDFNVLANKKYSFLIDDDLCDLHVERQDKCFAYGLEVNNNLNPARNRLKRAAHRRDLAKSLVTIALLVAMVVLSSFILL